VLSGKPALLLVSTAQATPLAPMKLNWKEPLPSRVMPTWFRPRLPQPPPPEPISLRPSRFPRNPLRATLLRSLTDAFALKFLTCVSAPSPRGVPRFQNIKPTELRWGYLPQPAGCSRNLWWHRQEEKLVALRFTIPRRGWQAVEASSFAILLRLTPPTAMLAEGWALIPAPSQRHAMDWSLALLSQGIEPGIEHILEADAWGLSVPLAEHARALTIIQQYRTENRGWPWRRELALPDFVFDAGSLVWVLLIGAFFGLSEADPHFKAAGVMDVAAVSRGEWWRLVTAVFLHADVAHLATNSAIGFVLLALALGRYGTGIGALAALLAGVFGNAVVWLLCAAPRTGLGASGMVLGALGLLAAQWFALREAHPRVWLTGLGAGGLLFMLLGSSPGTDVLAHAGGFVGGLLLGIVPAHYPKLARNGAANLLAGFLFAALTLTAWWLALR